MKKILTAVMVFLIVFSMFLKGASLLETQTEEWSEPRQLTTGPTQDYHASVMQDSDGKIWLVWARSMAGETGDVWYMTSSDGGLSWSASNGEILVPDTLQEGGTSILQDSTGRIWVVWASGQYSPSIDWDIFCTYSDDGGRSWASRKQLTDSPYTDNYPALIEVSGEIRIYYMQQPASNKIWYLNTTLGEERWNGPYQISTSRSERVIAPHPLLDSTGKLWIVWTQNKDVYFKISIDNGASWSSDQRLTTGPYVETTPCIVEDVYGKIFVFYTIADIPGPHADIWYKTTVDCGNTWSESQELTDNVPTEDNGLPCTSLINNEIWVVWSDTSGDIDLWLAKPAMIHASVNIDPDTLNLKSNGQWITAYITLPEGYGVEDIIPETVKITDIPLVWSEIQDGVFMAKFDRTAVQGLTNEPDHEEGTKFDELTLTIRGKLIDGTPFEGIDTIRVIMK